MSLVKEEEERAWIKGILQIKFDITSGPEVAATIPPEAVSEEIAHFPVWFIEALSTCLKLV